MRRCPICEKQLPEADFYRDRTKASGFSSRCKTCDNARRAEHYAMSKPKKSAGNCGRCGRPKPSARRRYCDPCRDVQARKRKRKSGSYQPKPPGWTTAKGYGRAHQQLRKAWAPKVATGVVRCARGADCERAEVVFGETVGGLILPGEPWDLGHDDHDRSRYHGPEHQRCNRRAGAKQKAAARKGVRSRRWW